MTNSTHSYLKPATITKRCSALSAQSVHSPSQSTRLHHCARALCRNQLLLPHQRPTTAERFAPPKTTEEIVRAREKGIPKRTQQDTKYCVNIWDEWREYRRRSTGIVIAPLQQLPPHQLNEFLTMFVLEARKKTGEVYPPNTLHHIVCGLMRHLPPTGNPQIDFFRDPEFSGFRASLDAEMKRLQEEGVGLKRKQADRGRRKYSVGKGSPG